MPKKRNLQRRLSKTKETSSSEGNNTLLSSSTYLVYITFVHILYIYLSKDNVFQEELYLWKNNKIRTAIIIQGKPKSESIMKRLRRSKDRKKSTIKKKLEKDLRHFVEDNKTEAWTLLYIAEDNKDVDGSMESVRQREPIICTLT